MSTAPGRASTTPVFATAQWAQLVGHDPPLTPPQARTAPIEHEQAYTPPPQEDTNTIADGTDTITEPETESEAMDVGEQTATNQPQPATTGAR